MNRKTILKFLLIPLVCITLSGCATTYPKNILKLPEDSLQVRQLQMRQFETIKEEEIITASAGVLQDLGFTLDDSETKLGLIVASKSRDATNTGQATGAWIVTILSALGGSSSDALSQIDAVQKIRASVVTALNNEGTKVIVRVTFQRIVWNKTGVMSKMETLKDPKAYQGFFEKLSKAIFLEEQKI